MYLLSPLHLLLAASIATLAASGVAPANGDHNAPDVIALKGCSGKRELTDACEGKKLQEMNSFHNCKQKASGKCCAKNKDGTGGLDVSDDLKREDCGYCFGGKCKGG